MFAEDLQGDIYNSSPGVSILILFSHSEAHTENIPSTPRAPARPFWDCDIGLVVLHKQRGLKKVEGHIRRKLHSN